MFWSKYSQARTTRHLQKTTAARHYPPLKSLLRMTEQDGGRSFSKNVQIYFEDIEANLLKVNTNNNKDNA